MSRPNLRKLAMALAVALVLGLVLRKVLKRLRSKMSEGSLWGLALPITGGGMPGKGKGRAAAQGARASP
jgi:hypothetical protein